MRYAVIIERAERNYAAYVPDLSGVHLDRGDGGGSGEAIESHLEGMRKVGEPIPEPTTLAESVEASPGMLSGIR